MAEKPDIRVLIGVADDASIDSGSGKLISNTLTKIAKKISSDSTRVPKVAFTINAEATTKNITAQLSQIIKSIKVEPLSLNIRTNQSSIGSIEEKRALADIEVQKKKNEEATKKETKAENERLAIISRIVDSQRLLNNAENNANKLGNTELTGQIQKTKAELAQLVQKLETFYASINGSKNIGEHINNGEFVKLTSDIETCNKAVIELQKISSKDSALLVKDERWAKQARDVSDFTLSLQKFEKANDKFKSNSGLSAEFERIIIALAGLERRSKLGENIGVELDQLKSQTNNWKASLEAAGLTGQTAFGKLRAQMEKLGVYFGASAIMMGAWRQVKQTISTVIELDGVVTDLSVATGKNREETKALLDTYSELGKELGATTSAVAKAGDDWLRQGKSIATTNKLIKDSLMLSKLGKIDSSEATTALTTMSKAYKVTDDNMTSLVDKLTAVDTVSATTAGGIAKSFQETAVSANLAGISIDRMAGYIATVSEISGDAPESVGTFFRTFLSRMSNIKEGRMIDPDTGEDLSTVETVLKNIGIQLRNDQGQFRNFQDVLDETAAKWKELEATGDKVGQTKIASALGLTRQQEKAKILFENYDEAIKYAEISANSLGTAEEKFNNAYLTSTQASMDAFTAQYEQMSNVIWDSGLIKGTFDTGAGFLGALTWIIDNLGAIPTLVTVAAGALSAINNKGGLAKIQWQHITCVESQRTYALYNLVETLNELIIISKRLYNKSLKWCA